MSFLSKLFGRESPTLITSPTRLADELHRVRQGWFEICAKTITLDRMKKGRPSDRAAGITQQSLGGTGDLATKAFQLLDASQFIQSRAYTTGTEGDRFLDNLWACVCGTQRKEILTYFARYYEAYFHPKEGDNSALHKFAVDVTKYCAGSDNLLLEEVLCVVGEVNTFTCLTSETIASGFGDRKTAQFFRRKLEESLRQATEGHRRG
jgi:hypothetical protein